MSRINAPAEHTAALQADPTSVSPGRPQAAQSHLDAIPTNGGLGSSSPEQLWAADQKRQAQRMEQRWIVVLFLALNQRC